MTDADALLRAILADPHEDTPRLVYADLLDERGEHARAEFIRVQCKLAELEKMEGRPAGGAELAGFLWGYHRNLVVLDAILDKEHGTECEYCLRKRLAELTSTPEKRRMAWGDTPPFMKLFPELKLTRGFVSFIACSWNQWRDNAAAILERCPIERVRLTTTPDYLGDDTRDFMLKEQWPGIEFELPPVAIRQPPPLWPDLPMRI